MKVQVEESYLNHLIHISEHDELTGVMNRYGIKRKMDELYNPDGQGFICVVDIDNFKVVNDVAGHVAGDVVLRSFAEALVGLRNSHVGRLGGDEFFVFIGGIEDKDELQEEFKALGDRVDAIAVPGHDEIKVTYSAGAYYLRGNREELLQCSYTKPDRLCYESKKIKGNSVTIEI